MPKRYQHTRVNRQDARALIERMETFSSHTGSLRGEAGCMGTGYLPPDHKASSLYSSPYVVYSYGTPIAWVDADKGLWVRPPVKYSMTTSHHQGRVPVDGAPVTTARKAA